MSEWTPGMPPINTRTVLASDGNTIAIVWWDGRHLLAEGRDVSQFYQYKPTHWMPLPDLPAKEHKP